MTSRPRFATDFNYRNGVGALLLFAVLAWTFAQATFERPMGFGEGSITRSVGFALFDMLQLIPSGHGETEGFLVALIIIAVVLDAALDGAVMLARREEDESVVTAVADGGLVLGSSDDGADGLQSGDASADDAPTDDGTSTDVTATDVTATDDQAEAAPAANDPADDVPVDDATAADDPADDVPAGGDA